MQQANTKCTYTNTGGMYECSVQLICPLFSGCQHVDPQGPKIVLGQVVTQKLISFLKHCWSNKGLKSSPSHCHNSASFTLSSIYPVPFITWIHYTHSFPLHVSSNLPLRPRTHTQLHVSSNPPNHCEPFVSIVLS